MNSVPTQDKAASFFTEKGYRLLCRNYFTAHGEVDIVLANPEEVTLVFVEVKWTIGRYVSPDAPVITPAKLTALRHASVSWMKRYPEHRAPRIRYDVLTMAETGMIHTANVWT